MTLAYSQNALIEVCSSTITLSCVSQLFSCLVESMGKTIDRSLDFTAPCKSQLGLLCVDTECL